MVVKSQITSVTFFPILNTGDDKGVHRNKCVGKGEEDFAQWLYVFLSALKSSEIKHCTPQPELS